MRGKKSIYRGYVYGGLAVVALYLLIVGWTVFSLLTSACSWWFKLLSLALAVEIGVGAFVGGVIVGSWVEWKRYK